MSGAAKANNAWGVGLSLAYAAETLADLPSALDQFERLDLDAVEIFLPSLAVVVGGRVHARRLAQMKAICADRPFRLTLHGPLTGNFGDHEHVEAHRDAARAGLEAAAEIGAEVLVWHAAIARGVDLERSLASEREALHALAPAAEAARCRLCVETMYCKEGERTAAPSELAEHFASLESEWIGAVVDFSHSSLNCADRGLDLLTELEALAPYARHLHLHDSFARPRQFRTWSRGCDLTFGFGDLHLPPGDGALPWEALARLPWRAPMIANLELNQHWRAEWPEAIAWTRRWIDQARAGALGH